MSILAFLYAVLSGSQLGGSELQGNPYWDAVFDYTVQNLHSIQSFFGWMALISIGLLVLVGVASTVRGKGFLEGIFAAGCFIYFFLLGVMLWLVGWLHIWMAGYLATHFTATAGATSPGFWVVLVVLILSSWT